MKLNTTQNKLEANKQFEKLLKLGIYKQLYKDGIISEKQFKSIQKKYKMS